MPWDDLYAGIASARLRGRYLTLPTVVSYFMKGFVVAQYRKKPVVIDAFQWTGGPDQTEDPEWVVEAIRNGSVRVVNYGTANVVLVIETLEGSMRANQGDWIIRGVKGEIYPCKPDIFEATYEPLVGAI